MFRPVNCQGCDVLPPVPTRRSSDLAGRSGLGPYAQTSTLSSGDGPLKLSRSYAAAAFIRDCYDPSTASDAMSCLQLSGNHEYIVWAGQASVHTLRHRL